MLTTQNTNPMTTFNYDYWVKLRSHNQAAAEEYRLQVTAPKPGSISTQDLRVGKKEEVEAEIKEEKLEQVPVEDEKEEIAENTVETVEEKTIDVVKEKRGRPFQNK